MQFSLKGDQEWIHWSTWREVDGQPLGQLMGQDHGGNKHKLTAVLHCRLLQARKRQDNSSFVQYVTCAHKRHDLMVCTAAR